MELEKIAAVVRPRRPWEAVDLGFMMARAWWGPVARAWLAIVVPFVVVATGLLYASPRWALFVVWWAKPLYDRVPLYVLSRGLFGSTPSTREVLRRMPRLWLAQSFSALTWRRLDPMRALLMPVGQLENLRGAEHGRRTAVLKRGGGDATAASWLAVVCLGFELAAFLGLVGVLEMLRPENVEQSFWGIFAFLGGGSDVPAWHAYLALGLYLLAMSLIEPFYVAGGFALYLNRRTQLEGWDVELAFRRMARRLEHPRERAKAGTARAAVLLALATGLTLAAPPAEAQTGERDPQEVIEEVLADPDFGSRRTVSRWRLRFETDPAAPPESEATLGFMAGLVALLGQVFELLLWALLAVVLTALAVASVRRFRPPARRARSAAEESRAQVICGLDVSADALPDDVVAAALAAWREGRADEALSLLYRGALAWLVDRRRLPARESWTEDDCLRHLNGAGAASPLTEYFARLTRVWQRTAYAHRPPSDDEMGELANGWPEHFPRAGAAP